MIGLMGGVVGFALLGILEIVLAVKQPEKKRIAELWIYGFAVFAVIAAVSFTAGKPPERDPNRIFWGRKWDLIPFLWFPGYKELTWAMPWEHSEVGDPQERWVALALTVVYWVALSVAIVVLGYYLTRRFHRPRTRSKAESH